MATRSRTVKVKEPQASPATSVASEQPSQPVPDRPAATIKPAPVDPAAPVSTPSAKAKNATGRVRPKNPFPIYVAGQNVVLPVGQWTLVELDGWVDTQLKAGILEQDV